LNSPWGIMLEHSRTIVMGEKSEPTAPRHYGKNDPVVLPGPEHPRLPMAHLLNQVQWPEFIGMNIYANAGNFKKSNFNCFFRNPIFQVRENQQTIQVSLGMMENPWSKEIGWRLDEDVVPDILHALLLI